MYGTGYNKTNRRVWQLLNCIVEEVKMAVYISRQIKIEGVLGTYATSVWRLNRIKLEFVLFFNSSKTL